MDNFDRAMSETLIAEAGDYHPKPGAADQNPTRKGVTQHTYDTWRTSQGLSTQSVFEMTDDEVKSIYRQYWDGAHCSELPFLVALPCFDMSINAGPVRAIKSFQQAAGATGDDIDGVWGPKTAAAAYTSRQDEVRWAHRVQTARLAFYVQIADQPNELPNLRSWVSRVVAFNRKYLS